MEDKQSVESINDRLQEFDKTFTALQEQMDVRDYHDLVAAYATKEEENFALFRYVQGVNNEVEQLEDETHAIEREMQKYERRATAAMCCANETLTATRMRL